MLRFANSKIKIEIKLQIANISSTLYGDLGWIASKWLTYPENVASLRNNTPKYYIFIYEM